jgi:hypothetical protein
MSRYYQILGPIMLNEEALTLLAILTASSYNGPLQEPEESPTKHNGSALIPR